MTPRSRIHRLVWILAALLASLCMAAPCRAQEGDRAKERRKALLAGTHVFRRILHDDNLVPLKGFEDLREEPQRCILIVLGDLRPLAEAPDGLARFVRAGGALLAASDRFLRESEAGEQLEKVAGVAIGPDTYWSGIADPRFCYHGLNWCPFVEPIKDAVPSLFKAALPLGDTTPPPRSSSAWLKVATNVPSCLIPQFGAGEHNIFPGSVRPMAKLIGMHSDTPPYRSNLHSLFAVGGEVGQGRVLVLADHSLFINEMMLPTDNQNVEFTYNCVAWLSDNGRRDRVLFVEDGRIQADFNIPLKSVNVPLEDALKLIFARRNELLVEFEKGAARMEEDDLFNRKLFEFLDSVGLPIRRLAPYLATILTGMLLLYGVYRLGLRQRFRHETSAPLLGDAVGRSLPVQPLLAQRTDVLLQRGNLWEPAAMLVRRWFARLGVAEAQGKEPPFTVQGSWRQRRTVLARLRRLWRLADGRQPERVTAPQLWSLQRELDELRASWSRGQWSVTTADH